MVGWFLKRSPWIERVLRGEVSLLRLRLQYHFFGPCRAKELATVEREIREIIDAIKSGIRGATMATEMEALENRKEELQRKLAAKPEPPIRLHPNLAEVYRRRVENLREALGRDDAREEAVAILRGLIDQIRLESAEGQLGIYLVGNLAAILGLCTKKHPGSLEAGVEVTLVAGARFIQGRTSTELRKLV